MINVDYLITISSIMDFIVIFAFSHNIIAFISSIIDIRDSFKTSSQDFNTFAAFATFVAFAAFIAFVNNNCIILAIYLVTNIKATCRAAGELNYYYLSRIAY